MFLIFNKYSGLVVEASDTEPILTKGQDVVFVHDPDLNLTNYKKIKVIAKEGCHLELKPSDEWISKLSRDKLEQCNLALMDVVAKLSDATPGAESSELMAQLVLAGKRPIDQLPADIQKDVTKRTGIG